MKLYKIKKSKIDNKRGLYATKDIKEGTKIINYIGKIITNREVEESAKFDNNKPIYLFTLNNRYTCLLYTSPSPRDSMTSRMPSSA